MTAVITGASSGIGAATARTFAAEGARVAMLARRRDPLDALADELDGAAIAIPTDVAHPQEVADAVERADRELDGIDIVVNSAGVVVPRPLADLDAEAWRSVIDTNLSGSFYVAREAGLRMLAGRGGTIVNIGSEFSVRGMAMLVAYCATKAGLIGLTKALAAELAPRVRVNAVCPGAVDTPMLENAQKSFGDPQTMYDRVSANVPLRRVATPEEIAAAILYVVADAPYATGAALHLDGGTTI
jgi:NAD(P)-dependent dehydrogenase (short-subunit alcohol dehydrogenase family)